MEKKHFVLVHGACHGAWCWYKLGTLLESDGHKVTALDMAASGVNPKRVDEVRSLLDYFGPLVEFMEAVPDEEKVVLVGHSLGGVGLSIAMERFPHKVSVAVFATATMPGPHLSLVAIDQEFNRTLGSTMDTTFTHGDGPNNPPTSLLSGPKFLACKLYQLSPPEDLMLATLSVRPHRLYPDLTPLEEIVVTEEKYGSVNRVFIVCDQDNCQQPTMQKWMIANNPPNEVKEIVGSDHMVMLSRTQELFSHLQEISQKYS